ncbi:type II secretion system F family protein [archaeon]|nr:MAG: type II secretion system F family protein [archaeon]
MYTYLLNYPSLIASRNVRTLEKDMLSAMQHMLIEVKSGVPLFNSMVGISEGYGNISREFRKITKEINAGVKETDALDEATQRNPFVHFRRVLWQIANALRSGSDVASTLQSIVENLSKEQIIAAELALPARPCAEISGAPWQRTPRFHRLHRSSRRTWRGLGSAADSEHGRNSADDLPCEQGT